MIFSRQANWWLACWAAGQLISLPLCAENSTPPSPVKLFSVPTNIIPPVPPAGSPVDFFRQLLAMPPSDRARFLTNKPAVARARLLAKVREYEVLGPDERELRLRATELRWHLLPFFHEPATNHAARLALVPDDLRELVKTRVEEWDALPPQLQQEFLANEPALLYFTHVDSLNNPPPLPPLPTGPEASIIPGTMHSPAGTRSRRMNARRSPRSSASFLNSHPLRSKKPSTPCRPPNAGRCKEPCSRSTNCPARSVSNAFAPTPNLRA